MNTRASRGREVVSAHAAGGARGGDGGNAGVREAGGATNADPAGASVAADTAREDGGGGGGGGGAAGGGGAPPSFCVPPGSREVTAYVNLCTDNTVCETCAACTAVYYFAVFTPTPAPTGDEFNLANPNPHGEHTSISFWPLIHRADDPS